MPMETKGLLTAGYALFTVLLFVCLTGCTHSNVREAFAEKWDGNLDSLNYCQIIMLPGPEFNFLSDCATIYDQCEKTGNEICTWNVQTSANKRAFGWKTEYTGKCLCRI